MRPLRFAALWLGLGATLLITGLVLALIRIEFPFAPNVTDKFVHLAAFGGFTLWFSGIFAPRAGFRVALGMFAYGLLIELLQSLVPHRLADPVDVMFNVAGIGVGWGLARTALGGWCETLESWIGAGRAA